MTAARGYRRLPAAVALLALTLGGCGGGGAAEAPPSSAAPVLQSVVVQTRADRGRTWDGTVQAQREATLSAQTSGRVATLRHDVGDRVAAGEVLLRLSAVEQQAAQQRARAGLAAAEAALAEAGTTLRRYRELAQRQHVSQAQLDQVEATQRTAAAMRDAARAALADASQSVAYTEVAAPYDAVVGARMVEAGESVVAGQALLLLFAPDALRVEVQVPAADAARIRALPQAQLELDDGRVLDAADVTVFPQADPLTHAVAIRLTLPPLAPAPPPGSALQVRFAATAGEVLPRIPQSALLRRGEVAAVYVLGEDGITLRQLRLGARDGEMIDVIAGLQAGERIAADPVQAMQARARGRGD